LKGTATGTFTYKVNAVFTVFAEEAAKARWKGLRDNFRKEIKSKPRLGDGAPPQTLRWIHFKVLQFLRDVMEPGKTSSNIAFTPICNAEQQESQDEKKNEPGGNPGIRG
jgi:hypothetical protein